MGPTPRVVEIIIELIAILYTDIGGDTEKQDRLFERDDGFLAAFNN